MMVNIIGWAAAACGLVAWTVMGICIKRAFWPKKKDVVMKQSIIKPQRYSPSRGDYAPRAPLRRYPVTPLRPVVSVPSTKARKTYGGERKLTYYPPERQDDDSASTILAVEAAAEAVSFFDTSSDTSSSDDSFSGGGGDFGGGGASGDWYLKSTR